MKVFISWSGEASRRLAEALREWLPSVIQAVKPFMSSEDIHKGKPWFEEIGTQLEETHFGLLCLTPSNQDAPWIQFEAGALSKRIARANVVPLLVNLTPGELKPPLSNFNAAVASSKDEVRRVLRDINEAIGKDKLSDAQLDKAFARAWPELEPEIAKAAEAAAKEGANAPAPKRHPSEQLEELLAMTRGLVEQVRTLQPRSRRLQAAFEGAPLDDAFKPQHTLSLSELVQYLELTRGDRAGTGDGRIVISPGVLSPTLERALKEEPKPSPEEKKPQG